MTDLRLTALTAAIAAKRADDNASDLTAAAEIFFNFLQAPATVPAGTAAPAAPAKRPVGRPHKAAKAAPPAESYEGVDELPEEQGAREVQEKLEEQAAAEKAARGPSVPVTAESVASAITTLLRENKRETAVELLKKYGAASKSLLDPKHYAAFLADVDEALAAA